MKTNYLGRLTGSTVAILVSAQEAVASPSAVLAQIPGTLKTSFQYGLGILFLAGFLYGVLKIWGGADRMSKGDTDGKMGIVAGIVIAGSAAIMSALFVIFGMADGALTPQF